MSACCRYQGQVEGDSVPGKTLVRFTWCVRAPGVYETYDTELQCRHAVTRGVPVPKEWKGKLASRAGTPAVDEFAMKAVKRALVELGLEEGVKLDCRPTA